jgi:hypothetical protein
MEKKPLSSVCLAQEIADRLQKAGICFADDLIALHTAYSDDLQALSDLLQITTDELICTVESVKKLFTAEDIEILTRAPDISDMKIGVVAPDGESVPDEENNK